MRARFFAYIVALLGLWAALAAAIMLGRALVTLGASRASPGAVLGVLATGPGATWLWLGVAAATVCAGAWALAERQTLPAERDAAGRKALLYVGQMASLAALIFQVIRTIIAILNRPAYPENAVEIVQWAVGAAIALVFWAFLRWVTVGDGDFGQEASNAAGWRRLYYYGGAAAMLCLFLFGLLELLRIILGVGLGAARVAAVTDRARFVQAAALALVGAPAWWALWWAQQARARSPDPFGARERAALTRRLYLYTVIMAAAAAFFFGVGMSLFGILVGRNLAPVVAWAPLALIGLICLVGHLWTLRTDERDLAGETRSKGTPAAAAAVAAAWREADAPSPATGAPRRFERAALPASPMMARAPIILVIDGGDGELGARLIAALAGRLPDVVLWPLGLNAAAQVALLNALGGAVPAVPADAPARATLIVGPTEILIADGLDGEVSAELAAAVMRSPARKLLLPPRQTGLRWVAAPTWPLERWAENAAVEAANALIEGRR